MSDPREPRVWLERGVWRAQVYLGRDPATGKRTRPRTSFPDAADEAQAREMAHAWALELTGGGQARSTLLADMLDAYVADRLAKGASPNTARRWRLSNRYVRRYLRGAVAPSLTPAELSAFERRLLEPQPRGQGLSRSSVAQVHNYLRAAYSRWAREGVVVSNPMLSVTKPAVEAHEAVIVDEWDYPSVESALSQALASPASASERACALAAWLSLHTGMRVGEVCALRRRDVLPRSKSIHVCGNVIEDGPRVWRRPKTKGGHGRTISVTDADVALIRSEVAAQGKLPHGHGADTPVVTVSGSFMRPSTVSRAWARLRDRLGLPKKCTFHSLRHTHATWLLVSGVDIKTVSERLGHADTATTLRIYAHVLPGRDKAAAEAFEAFASELSGAAETVQKVSKSDDADDVG